jgi:tetratricopeptide (TPR) repeat protein
LEFDKADAIFKNLIQQDPASPVGHFFIGMVQWWKILLDIDDTSNDDKFYDMMDKVIDVCDERIERNSQDVEALFFKCGALGFRGRLRANRGSWFKAANDGREALPIVWKAKKIDPENVDVLFGVGIYNYYAESIPEKYPATKPLALLFPKGDKKKGIEMLQTAAEKGKYSSTEALYFLLQIYFLYDKDNTKALVYAKQLHDRYPANSFFYRYVGRVYAASGFWTESEKIYTDVLAKCLAGQPTYTDYVQREARYYIAMALMNYGKTAEAMAHFKITESLCKKVDHEKDSPYLVMTTLRLGMLYDLQGNREMAVAHYNKVRDMQAYLDSQDKAKEYLKKPYTGS